MGERSRACSNDGNTTLKECFALNATVDARRHPEFAGYWPTCHCPPSAEPAFSARRASSLLYTACILFSALWQPNRGANRLKHLFPSGVQL